MLNLFNLCAGLTKMDGPDVELSGTDKPNFTIHPNNSTTNSSYMWMVQAQYFFGTLELNIIQPLKNKRSLGR